MAVAAFGFLSLVCCFCFVVGMDVSQWVTDPDVGPSVRAGGVVVGGVPVVLLVWMAWRLTDSVPLGVLSGAVAAYLVWRGLLSSQRMHADRASGDEVVRR